MFKELKEIMTTISHQIETIIKRQTKSERKKKKESSRNSGVQKHNT